MSLAAIGAGVGAVIGGYVLTSFILTKKPIFFVRAPLAFAAKVKHISHRGGAGEHIENTMSAFKHAVRKARTDMLELDVHLTSDGKVVVSHDHNLLRQCGQNVNIGNLKFSNLPAVNARMLHRLAPDCVPADDYRMPLLEEVFQEFPSLPINLDIKHDSDELIERVSQLIQHYDRESITVWGNFSHKVCQKCYAHNPNIPMLFSVREVITTVLYFYIGLLPFIPLRPQFFEVMMPSAFTKINPEAFAHNRQRRLLVWLASKLLIRKSLFEHLRKRGVYVFLWVVNEPEDFELAFNFHCNGIMTDFPTRLRAYLDRMERKGEVLPAEDYNEDDD